MDFLESSVGNSVYRLEKEQIDKNLDDIMTNLDALRKYEIITKKNNTTN